MKRLLYGLALVAWLTLPSTAQAQELYHGTISTAGADCSTATRCVIVPERQLYGVGAFSLYLVLGTSGTFNFEAEIWPDVWFAVQDDATSSTSATVTGEYFFTNKGYRRFRVRASAISGAATLLLYKGSSSAAPSSGGLTNTQLRAQAVEVDPSGVTSPVDLVAVGGVAPLPAYRTADLQSAASANGDGTTLNVLGYGGVIFTVRCTTTCSGGTTITLQGTEDGTRYSTMTSAMRVDGKAVGGVITNQTSSDDSMWYAPVSGLQAVKAVISAYSAGVVSVTARAVVPGNGGIVQVAAAVTGGASNYTTGWSSAAVTAEVIKGSPGMVYDIQCFNVGANEVYARLYNQTGTPGTGDGANIIWRGAIPGNDSSDGGGYSVSFPMGRYLSSGIGIRVSAAVADNDATVLTASEVVCNVGYK